MKRVRGTWFVAVVGVLLVWLAAGREREAYT